MYLYMNLVVDKNIPIERFFVIWLKTPQCSSEHCIAKDRHRWQLPRGRGCQLILLLSWHRVGERGDQVQTHHLSVSIWEMGWPISFFKTRLHPGGCKFCVDWVSCSDSLLIQWASPFLTSDVMGTLLVTLLRKRKGRKLRLPENLLWGHHVSIQESSGQDNFSAVNQYLE